MNRCNNKTVNENQQTPYNRSFSSFFSADPIVQVDRKPKCCFFSFSPKIQANRIVKAQLWVHLRPAEGATTVFLQISRLMPLTDGGRHIRIRSLKIDVNAGVTSWQSIDVKQVLAVWLRQPETNWGIEINAYDAKGNDLAVTSAEPGEDGLVSWAVNMRFSWVLPTVIVVNYWEII